MPDVPLYQTNKNVPEHAEEGFRSPNSAFDYYEQWKTVDMGQLQKVFRLPQAKLYIYKYIKLVAALVLLAQQPWDRLFLLCKIGHTERKGRTWRH